MHAVWAEALGKRYGKITAVHRFDLQLEPGSVCGLAGPNGAGKTTTIGMLLGLIKPSSGSARVLGLDPKKQSFQVRQRVGYVPERHWMYEWMKVPQVLRLAEAMYPTWNKTKAKDLIELLGLPTNREVKQLSKGELAKLALVIALAHEPGLLILDEATSGLDPVVRRELLDLTRESAKRRGCTILFSSHILSDIERVADRAVVMYGGRIIADDALENLRKRYVRVSMLFPLPPAEELVIPHALRVERSLREWVVTFPSSINGQLREIAQQVAASDCMIQQMTFDDLFLELVAEAKREGQT